MNKTVKILLILLAVMGIAFLGLKMYTKSHSPFEKVESTFGEIKMSVEYCRPYKKNRKVFGGIVPYDKVWRTGANEATVVEFSHDVEIAGNKISAGKYSLWSIPNLKEWTIIVNKETGQWGTSYEEKNDIVRVKVPATIHPQTKEQLEIKFLNTPSGNDMVISWENTVVFIPIVGA
ncbi:MAG: DUF2911 domain-containing protein [Leadbetterella sp.]